TGDDQQERQLAHLVRRGCLRYSEPARVPESVARNHTGQGGFQMRSRHHESRLRAFAWAVCLGLLPAASGRAEEPAGVLRFTVTVAETAGIRRFGYPVRVVLSLPQPVKDTEHFRLLEGGKPVTAQFRPRGDNDQGFRAVSLDFNVNHAPLETREY